MTWCSDEEEISIAVSHVRCKGARDTTSEDRNLWQDCAKLPRPAAAVLAALHLTQPRPEPLLRATDRDWRQALVFSDRSQLTLTLRRLYGMRMPEWVRERIEADAAKNLLRLADIRELYTKLAGWLSAAGIEFLALKGLTQCPEFSPQPESRVQYDVDLFVPRDQILSARDLLYGRGFESISGMDHSPTDHLPALIRKTGWQWRGDYFDPDIPTAVEMHFRFWNPDVERLPAPGMDRFWSRRTERSFDGLMLPVLSTPDALAYAGLHLLRHLLRGDVRPFHALELAHFLNSHAQDNEFWQTWVSLHPPELRRLEVVAFRLATAWLGGAVPEVVKDEWERLPDSTATWFEHFALSPAGAGLHPNKDEIWLHLSLITNRRDRWRIVRRRLLPGRLPGPVDAVYLPDSQMNLRRRLRRRLLYLRYCAGRIHHHLVTIPGTAIGGLRFLYHYAAFRRELKKFLAAAVESPDKRREAGLR